MGHPLQGKLVAGLIGAAVIGGVVALGAVILPALVQTTMASERAAAHVLDKQPGKALDVNLARFDGDYYAIGHTPDVSLTPNSTAVVRKIAYGRTTFVSVYTTSSGTYSTDGLKSPNIRYPGIFTDHIHPVLFPLAGIYGWSSMTGWVQLALSDAHSFGLLDTDQAATTASQLGVCVADTNFGGCR